MFCNLRGLTQQGFNTAAPPRCLSPPPPRFISSVSAYSLSYLRRKKNDYTAYLPHQTCPRPHRTLTSSFLPCVSLSDHCIIQFKLAYLPHLPVTALVSRYHLYWLTCPSLRRRTSTGGHLSICACENVRRGRGRLFCGGR